MSIKTIIKKIFFEWEWLCAFRRTDYINTDLTGVLNDKNAFTVIDVGKGYWAADPFLFKDKNGDVYCFFEYFNKKKRKAVIAYKNISQKDSKVGIAYEFDGHTSYPCVFEFGGSIYMIPETKYLKKIVLLKNVEWPSKWIEIGTLKDNICAVDSTPFVKNDELFLFIYEEYDDFENRLSLAKVDVVGCALLDETLLESYSKTEGRPGGNVLFYRDGCFRVVQPSRSHYGEKIEFLKFNFDNNVYSEKMVKEMLPSDIKLDVKTKIVGVHTFNCLDDYQVIDVLTKGVFSLTRPFKWFLSKIGIFGFDCYDNKRKRLFGDPK